MKPPATLPAALLLGAALLAGALPAQAALLLRVEGGEVAQRANVEAWIGPEGETGRMSYRALAAHAEKQARLALQALGYYDPAIRVSRVEDDGNITCLVRIEPGEPVRIAPGGMQVVLEGPPEDDPLRDWAAANAPREGDVFHHGTYEAFRNGLMQRALTLGYFKAAWRTHRVVVEPEASPPSARIKLELVTGERARFGDVTIADGALDRDLLARFPRFAAGDGYDGDRIAALHRDFARTGWFETVSVKADRDAAVDGSVPVDIAYALRAKNRVGVGVGASTDVGPRVKGQYEKPWINDQGHSFSSYLELAQVRSQLEAVYLVPLADPVTSQLAWTYGLEYEDLNDYEYWLTTVGAENRRQLDNGWRLTRALEVLQETDDFGLSRIRTTLLLPGIGLSRSESAGVQLVTRGWRVATELQGASEALLSDTDILRWTGDAKGIHALGSRTRVILRTSLGAMLAPDIDEVPVSLRFFAGGDQSVRGYDYESLGPVDAAGVLVGGRYLASGSAELDYRFLERWLVAVFADSGSAFDQPAGPDFFTGVGTGVRWVSPIGPLRLDFAWGVTPADTSFNIHFYMGPEL